MKYQAYDEYKESCITWIGKVPNHWYPIRFKHVLLEKKKTSNAELDAGSISFGNVIYKNSDNLSVETKDSYQEVLSGEFLINPLNLNYDLLSLRTALSKINVVVSTGYIVLKSNNRLVKNYVRWLLQEFDVAHMKTLGSGVRQTINYSDIGNSFFFQPSQEEQFTIANFLGHETAKIDTLIEKQQQLIKLLKEKRQAVISHAVTKGLNTNAPMRDSGVEWLGEVPEHWNVYKLKHIITSLESGVSVNAADIPAYGDGLGVLKTSCVYTRSFRVEENKTVLKEEENRVKCPIRKGAIIISRMNTPDLVGASALVEVDDTNIYLPDRLWQTIFASNIKLNPKFISFFMMIKGFRNQISLAAEGASSSMQNIAKDDYLSINITLPDIAEQDVIVSHLENKLGYFQKLEERANKAIELIQERRTALISAAVTGKIDVRNWKAPEPLHSNNEISKEEAA